MDSNQILTNNDTPEQPRRNVQETDSTPSAVSPIMDISNISSNAKEPISMDERIIQDRGRRQWTKIIPKTPTKRKRRDEELNESPFTKCLRGMVKSPVAVNDFQSPKFIPKSVSSLRTSTPLTFPYQLRSSTRKKLKF